MQCNDLFQYFWFFMYVRVLSPFFISLFFFHDFRLGLPSTKISKPRFFCDLSHYVASSMLPTRALKKGAVLATTTTTLVHSFVRPFRKCI